MKHSAHEFGFGRRIQILIYRISNRDYICGQSLSLIHLNRHPLTNFVLTFRHQSLLSLFQFNVLLPKLQPFSQPHIIQNRPSQEDIRILANENHSLSSELSSLHKYRQVYKSSPASMPLDFKNNLLLVELSQSRDFWTFLR